jgi:hypothetical protein
MTRSLVGNVTTLPLAVAPPIPMTVNTPAAALIVVPSGAQAPNVLVAQTGKSALTKARKPGVAATPELGPAKTVLAF